MNPKALLPLLLAVLLSCAGARAAAPVVVTHLADGKKTALTVRITEEIKILLPAPADAAPGFEWQILSNDSRILRLTRSPKAVTATDKPAADKSPAPAAGTWTTSFFALRRSEEHTSELQSL